MYILGHMALGYFSAKIIKNITGYNFNIFIVWFLSVLPDIDLIIPSLLHRGPTHSLTIILLVFIITYLAKIKLMPYVAAFGSHSLIGDLLTSNVGEWGIGVQLFWPFTAEKFSLPLEMSLNQQLNIEQILFIIMIVEILYSKFVSKRMRK